MTEIRGNTNTTQAGRPGRPAGGTTPAGETTTDEAANGATTVPTNDRTNLTAGRQPGSSAIALGSYPVGGPAGQTFSSQGATAPKEAGERVAVTTTTGDFEVQTQWGERNGKVAMTGVGVMANDQGDFVTVDDQGGVQLGGEAIQVGTGAPVNLKGGGTVSRGLDGGIGVRSSKGDNVSITTENGRVGYRAVLAGSRAADTVIAGGKED